MMERSEARIWGGGVKCADPSLCISLYFPSAARVPLDSTPFSAVDRGGRWPRLYIVAFRMGSVLWWLTVA